MRKLCVLAAMLAISSSSHASDLLVKPMMQLGYTAGGDKMVTYSYTDGSSSSIYAGGSGEFGGGVEISSADSPFTGTISLNYHYATTDTNANASAKFSRWPLEFMGYYNFNSHFRIGGGLRYVISPQLDEDVGPSIDYENTWGRVIEAGYSFSRHMTASLRYVYEQYTPSNNSAYYVFKKVDGSHVGLFLQFSF